MQAPGELGLHVALGHAACTRAYGMYEVDDVDGQAHIGYLGYEVSARFLFSHLRTWLAHHPPSLWPVCKNLASVRPVVMDDTGTVGQLSFLPRVCLAACQCAYHDSSSSGTVQV